MKVWNITCQCGHDADYRTLKIAKKEALEHLTHYEDGKVYIDQVETDMLDNGDYQTGKSIIISILTEKQS